MSDSLIASTCLVTEANEAKFVNPIPRKMADVSPHAQKEQTNKKYKMEIVWLNVMVFVILHTMAAYGLYLFLTSTKLATFVFVLIYASFGGVGVTAGAHRLWSHKAYKAKLPMRIILMFMQCAAHQNCIHEWVRDHRAHHKWTDTDADPHNSRRGFFFSHMGWLMVKKHPELRERGRGIDMSDMEADSVVAFQKKYFYFLMPIICFIIPTYVPVYFFNENLKVAFFDTVLRYTLSLHFTWLINSAAHTWGNKPYDKEISATECKNLAMITYGEGWHNYHHVFPWDYKAAELGHYQANISTAFIDFFAHFGLAYDLKSVPAKMVRSRALRTGDGNWKGHENVPEEDEDHVWGWDDEDMTKEDKEETEISGKSD